MSAIFSLAGKRILVTGASSGIGRQVCQTIAELGGTVIASGRDAGRLAQVVEGLPGGGHAAVAAELTEAIDRGRLVDEAGLLNGFVHAAGTLRILPFSFISEQAIKEAQAVNFEAPVLLTQALLKQKVIGNGAAIVFITSIAASHGAKGHALYAAGKAALAGAARSLALEVGGRRIRVNCLAPGMVRTPMAGAAEDSLSSEAMRNHEKEYPLGFGDPIDVAGAAAFLLSDAARWISGTTLICDGGFTAR